MELLGPNSVRELRCAKFTDGNGGVHTIPIKDGMTREEFRARVSRLGIRLFKHVDISASSEEIPWVESLFEGFKFEKVDWVQPSGPVTYGPLTIKITVTSHFFRAVAKVGFHYFLTKFPRFRGDEPCFSEIRSFIVDGCPLDDVPRFVTQSPEQFVHQLRSGDRLAAWGHLIAVDATYWGFRARVQLSVGPQNRSTVYTVRLGKNPSPVHYSEAYGDFFAYYPKDQRGDYDGEVSELGMVTRL